MRHIGSACPFTQTHSPACYEPLLKQRIDYSGSVYITICLWDYPGVQHKKSLAQANSLRICFLTSYLFTFQRIEKGCSGLGDPARFHMKKTRLHSESILFLLQVIM